MQIWMATMDDKFIGDLYARSPSLNSLLLHTSIFGGGLVELHLALSLLVLMDHANMDSNDE